MLLQADAAGDTNTIHWAVPHFPNVSHHLYCLTSFSPSVSSFPVLCLSTSSLSCSRSLCRSPIFRCSCFIDLSRWATQVPLSAPAYAGLCIYVLYLLCLTFLWLYLFLSLSFILSVLSSLSFTRPTLNRSGPARGFFLLKGSFSLPLCWPGGSGSVKHLETIFL